MHADVGDMIEVDARETSGVVRRGEVLEVRTEGNVVHYRVRWDDGHETIFFPSSDAHIVHPKVRH